MSEGVSLRQYILLSLMAYRGEGVPYGVSELAEHAGIVGMWIAETMLQWDSSVSRERVSQLEAMLDGRLFVGVENGRIRFKPSGKAD